MEWFAKIRFFSITILFLSQYLKNKADGGLFVFGIEVAFVPGESCLFGSLLGFLSRSRYKFLKKKTGFLWC